MLSSGPPPLIIYTKRRLRRVRPSHQLFAPLHSSICTKRNGWFKASTNSHRKRPCLSAKAGARQVSSFLQISAPIAPPDCCTHC